MSIQRSPIIALALTIMLFALGCSDDDKEPAQDSGLDTAVSPRDASPDSSHDRGTPRDSRVDIYTGPTWIGAPCTGAEQCANEGGTAVCLQGGEWVWPGGYCSEGCVVVDNVDPCPLGSHCEELAQSGANLETCIKNCFAQDDCETGYTCVPVPSAPYGACLVI